MDSKVIIPIVVLTVLTTGFLVGGIVYQFGLEDSQEKIIILEDKLTESYQTQLEMTEAWNQLKEDHIRISDELDKIKQR